MSPKSPALPDDSGVVQALEERDLTLTESLGKYRLLGALGTGGMADVYLAVADGPEGFRKLCVLKLLKEKMAEDEEYRAMFLDEARLAARLNHPNVVQTFEVGETHGRLMIAMEYVEGQPLNRVRQRLASEQFPLGACISVLCDVLAALEYAHGLSDFDGTKLGVVHRDVSPHNIIVGYDAGVKLVDFGIAKFSAAMQETQAGVLKGKVGYMAPEQASMHDLDGRADLFSVGVLLWEAIAGRRLCGKMSSRDVLIRRVQGNDPKIAEVVPEVDPRLAAICDRAMARLPEDRFGSAGELQLELEGWLKEHGEPSRKELSKALRDAFAADRDHLRSLVEQRMADSSLSGMRQSMSLAVAAGRVQSSAEVSIPPPPLLPAVPSSPLGVPPPSPPSATFTAFSAPRSSVPGLVVLGVAATVAFGIAATMYAVTSSHSPRAAEVASSAGALQPSPPGPARVSAPTEPASAGPEHAVIPVTPPLAVTARPGRPAFVGPVGRGSTGAVHPPTATTNPASSMGSPSPTPSPTPAKTPSRPLDEKDPYAP